MPDMKTRKRGFTLIELLVVILILAILAAAVVPRIIGRTDDAKRAKALQDITQLGAAMQQFRLDVGRYPTTEEGTEALRTQPSDADGWRGPYVEKAIPLDPWGFPYIYEYPGADDDSFIIESYGQDGNPGGEGNAADISPYTQDM
ncbi:MAG: type II secretion system protein GspG [Chthonomonas sp.]